MEKFNYGTVVVSHRVDLNKPIDHSQETISKCIRVGLMRNVIEGVYSWQVQVVYLNHKSKIRSKIYDINEYQLTIRHQGDMSIEL